MRAAAYGHLGLVKMLLQHGARVQHQAKVIRGKEAERVCLYRRGALFNRRYASDSGLD